MKFLQNVAWVSELRASVLPSFNALSFSARSGRGTDGFGYRADTRKGDTVPIVMECVIETRASVILQFIEGLGGDLHVTFEEGTGAAWLYDLLKPHVTLRFR